MQIDKKKILFSLLLFTLMLVKVSALHVYFHCEDSNVSIENCSTCDLAIESQQSQFMDVEAIDDSVINSFNLPSIKDHFIAVVLIVENEPSYYQQNRPPPVA